jgi:predicted hydrolase (HD superfamily)
MIRNDKEFKTTQERLEYFQNLLLQWRVSAKPEEFPFISSGYLAEIEKMQNEILEYLTRHSSKPIQTKATSIEKPVALV